MTSAKINLFREQFDAVLFDLDGVVTQTAKTHAEAWKQIFDEFLKTQPGENQPFDIVHDYQLYVDGKPRYDGVSSFLKSRGIELSWGMREEPPGFDSVCALGNSKNQKFLELVHTVGVKPYPSTIDLIKSLRAMGFMTAVITASENGRAILGRSNLLALFDSVVDGVDALQLGLQGKPAPDVFLEAAKQLKVLPEKAVVVEDAASGVKAGHQGHFGLVIGVARESSDQLLRDNGADVVVHDLSDVQVSDHERNALSDINLNNQDWILEYTEFIPEREKRRESLCALGNGYFTTRGAAPESFASENHYPGTYLAGGYNRLKTKLKGRVLEHEDLVNLPNWLPLTFKIEDEDWFNLQDVQILSYRQSLDIKAGILHRCVHFRDGKQRETTLSERRFVHMRHCHLAGLELTLTPHNWSGMIVIRTALDGRVVNAGSKSNLSLKGHHLKPVEKNVDDNILFLKMRMSQSRVEVAESARTLIFVNGKQNSAFRINTIEPHYVAQDMTIEVKTGDTIRAEKVVSLFTSRDKAISEAGLASLEAVQYASSFEQLLQEQMAAWGHLWKRFDLELEPIDGSSKLPSLILHLHIFQILQAASLHSTDLDIGIPARAWTGETYQGHIFWDELFVIPFLTLHMPGITAAALKYRHRRLDEARKQASKMGLGGALFPWQSGSNGQDETPTFVWDVYGKIWREDYTYLQAHVNSAVAYNIWQFYQVTGDLDFMFYYGAEMLFEIARFWASSTHYNLEKGRYEILNMVGPDEYHVAYPNSSQLGINNNAYTNIMAVWVLCRALELLDHLPDDFRNGICERLNLKASEIQLWVDVSRKMFIPFQSDGIISQFEGYDSLQEFPYFKDDSIDTNQLNVMLSNTNEFNAYKVSKQADVLMLFYLFSSEELEELFERLGYSFDYETIPKNVDYYIRRTANNSTLSRVAHAWILSRLDRAQSWKFLSRLPSANGNQKQIAKSWPTSWNIFLEALGSDLFDIQGGSTGEGLHMGAMAGTVDIVQRCYTGLVTRNGVLWFNPYLPDDVMRLTFNLYYKHQSLYLEVTQQELKITARPSSAEPIKIGFQGQVLSLKQGNSYTFKLPSRHQEEQKSKSGAFKSQ